MARIESHRPRCPRAAGATLIELAMAMLLAATLATIAVPGFRAHVLRAHRAEARHALLTLATAQERYYLRNNAYANDAALTTAPPEGLGLSRITPNGWYGIAIAAGADATGFTASATAAGAQRDDADCSELSIDSAGRRLARSRSGNPVAACWN